MLEKIKEYIRKDKIKAFTIIAAVALFIAGVIVTGSNTGDTYAVSDFQCGNTNYDVAVDFEKWGLSLGACCPSGWELKFEDGKAVCYVSTEIPNNFDPDGLGEIIDYCRTKHNITDNAITVFGAYDEDTLSLLCTAEPGSAKVTYDSMSGKNGPSSYIMVPGTKHLISSEEPVKDGLIFRGWDTSDTAATVIYKEGDSITVNENIILYAVYTAPKELNVVYNLRSGSWNVTSNKQVVLEGGTFKVTSDIPTPDDSSLEFKGWSTSITAASVTYVSNQEVIVNDEFVTLSFGTNQINLYAVYGKKTETPETYTLTYDANGGTKAPASVNVAAGQEIKITGESPERDGFTFMGWGTSASDKTVNYEADYMYTMPSSDVTLFAIWEKIDVSNRCYQCSSNSNILSWNSNTPSDNRCSSSNWTINSNKNQSNCKTYSITYNLKDGTGNIPVQYKAHGSTVKLTTVIPTKNGFDFKGWSVYTDASEITYTSGADYQQNGDRTLYAVWVEKTGGDSGNNNPGTKPETPTTYVVKYDANGGTGAPSDQTKEAGKALTLSSVKPTREGYTFLGWGTEADTEKVTYEPGDSYTKDASIKLYAVWQDEDDKTGNEVPSSPGTGDVLIYVVYIVGAGALGYSIYYFMRRRNSL